MQKAIIHSDVKLCLFANQIKKQKQKEQQDSHVNSYQRKG